MTARGRGGRLSTLAIRCLAAVFAVASGAGTIVGYGAVLLSLMHGRPWLPHDWPFVLLVPPFVCAIALLLVRYGDPRRVGEVVAYTVVWGRRPREGEDRRPLGPARDDGRDAVPVVTEPTGSPSAEGCARQDEHRHHATGDEARQRRRDTGSSVSIEGRPHDRARQ